MFNTQAQVTIITNAVIVRFITRKQQKKNDKYLYIN